MTTYTPELGQAIFGAPTGEHELPRYAMALFREVWREISRVFWNREQREFDGYGNDDPKIEGFTVRPYWRGDDDAPDAALPNFVFGEVEIRWYKYPGRGMSCNAEWTPDQWVKWFDEAMAKLGATDEATHTDRLGPQIPLGDGEDENPF